MVDTGAILYSEKLQRKQFRWRRPRGDAFFMHDEAISRAAWVHTFAHGRPPVAHLESHCYSDQRRAIVIISASDVERYQRPPRPGCEARVSHHAAALHFWSAADRRIMPGAVRRRIMFTPDVCGHGSYWRTVMRRLPFCFFQGQTGGRI